MSDWRYLNLNDGVKVKIDVEDFERVVQLHWRVEKNRGFYITIVATKSIKGKRFRFSLASFILEPPQGKRTLLRTRPGDGQEFDFRKSNLVFATCHEQNQMRGKLKTLTSTYRGVSFSSKYKKWTAQIRVSGTLIRLGQFDSEETAALAYNEAAIFHFGKFAFLNKVEHMTEPHKAYADQKSA